MISNFGPVESYISLYLVVNWFFSIFTTGWFLSILYNRRYLFVKPSIFLLLFTHIFFQWPLAIFSSNYEIYDPSYTAMAILIHTYTIAGLFISTNLGRDHALELWQRITRGSIGVPRVQVFVVIVLVAVAGGIMASYLSVVPLRNTGLWAILFAPERATIAREQSLKLVDNVSVKYLYSFLASGTGPLLAAVLAMVILGALKRRGILTIVLSIANVAALLFCVMITGARFPAVQLLFVMGLTIAFRRKLPLAPLKYLPLLIIVLLPAVALSIMREGQSLDFQRAIDYWFSILYNRVLVDPLDQGSLYVYYADLYGRFGLAAIPKLAAIVGVEPVNAPQIIGLALTNAQAESVNANAGYLLTYFSYFGWLSLPISLLLLWSLDFALVIEKALHQELLIPCVAAVNATTLSFVQSDFTTVLVSQGFAIILVSAFLTDRVAYLLTRRRVRRDLIQKSKVLGYLGLPTWYKL